MTRLSKGHSIATLNQLSQKIILEYLLYSTEEIYAGLNDGKRYVPWIERMKSFKSVKLFSLLFASILLALSFPAVSHGQLPGGKNNGGMNAAMVKLFGNNSNFVCRSEGHVYDKGSHETTTLPMGFEMLGSRIRLAINLGEVKSREMSPDAIASMKQMGMDQIITVLLPDKKIIRSIYPSLKSYAETPMDKEEAASALKNYKIDKSPIGKETIDGKATHKDNVTMTDDKGVQQKAIVWFTTDTHEFPVQIQIAEEDSTLIMRFKDVKLGRPELAHFEAPAGYTKYDNINAMMSDAITKKMNAPK